jgi:2-acylglycerol O-acyltransferase 2
MTDWLTPPSSPTTPPHHLLLVTPRRKVIPINPPGYVSPAMALNNEPADPAVRESQHLAPKSYADAAEEALAQDDNDAFDEATIKETPPATSRMSYNHSEPRPLGEMIDEDEMALPPNSPTLRHVVGRLEKPGSNGSSSRPDSIKGVSPSRSSSKSFKSHSPNPSHGSPIAIKSASPTPPRIDNFLAKGHNDHDLTNGIDTPAVEKANGLSYAGAVKEAEPTAPHVAEQNGTRSEDVVKEVDALAPSDANAQNGLNYAGAVKESEPTAPYVDEQNGPRSEDEKKKVEPAVVSNTHAHDELSHAGAVKEVEPTPLGVDEQDGHRLETVPEEARSSDTVDAPSQNGHSEVDADASQKGETTAPESKEQNGRSEADATNDPRPSTPSNKDTQDDHSYADAVKDVEPTSPHVDEQNGNAASNGVTAEKQEAPTSFSGVGRDDTPRSPTPKKAHKRVSSRSLKNAAKKQAEQQSSEGVMSYQREWQQGVQSSSSPETAAGLGVVFEEKYRSKSGLNLTTAVDADNSLEKASLSSRANKDITTEPQATPRHERKSSELVSGRRAGAGWATSAIRWAPANVPLQRRLQTLMVLVHTLSIAGGLALFFLLCAIPLLWPILLPYLVYVLLSHAPTSGELSHRSEWARNSRIWSLFASYYPARLHRTVPLEPTRKYIFGYHPHGIISHGAFAAFATEALGFKQLFPGITNTLLTLDANFRVPLYRDYALRMGLASVSRESCENILSKGGRNGEGMGRAITIVVGGARESLDAKPGSLKLVLKKRKGFVKLAIRQGADLVPTLAFGENDLYEQFDSAGHPYVHRAQLMVKKMLGFTVPLFHARGMSTLFSLS